VHANSLSIFVWGVDGPIVLSVWLLRSFGRTLVKDGMRRMRRMRRDGWNGMGSDGDGKEASAESLSCRAQSLRQHASGLVFETSLLPTLSDLSFVSSLHHGVSLPSRLTPSLQSNVSKFTLEKALLMQQSTTFPTKHEFPIAYIRHSFCLGEIAKLELFIILTVPPTTVARKQIWS
jgi:hypothetical protein